MKKAYIKDIIREIKRTRKRYISIIAIVILGVALFAGINSSTPDMLDTFNKYINDYNMYDLNLVSTVGFEKEDLDTIKNIDKIDYIEAIKSTNAITEKEDKERVITLISMPAEITENTINKIELVEGNYPTESNQIVLDSKLMEEYQIGETVEFIQTEDETLNVTSYTVVGFANSPVYIATSRGNTNLGDGTIYGFGMTLENAFSLEQYTNIYAKVITESKDRTSDEYIEEIKAIQEEIEKNTDKLAEEKYNKMNKEAQEKIADAKEEIQNAKQELSDAENKLTSARTDLQDAEKKLANEKQNYNKQIKGYESQIQQAENSLTSAKANLDKTQKEITDSLNLVNSEEKKLIAAENQVLEGTEITDLNKYIEYLKSVSAPAEAITKVQSIINGKKEIANQKNTLQAYQTELQKGLVEYNTGITALNSQKQELANRKKMASANFKVAENKINSGWAELETNKKKFEEEKANALKDIEDAEKEIADSEKKLEDLSVKIYVLNLETNEGYVSYKSDCENVATIGKVFPIIFFLVAALVSLTAMTRMVEENRGSIGTYKSLGYGKSKIASKYLVYAISATLLGIILGAFIGSYTLPWVIAKAYCSILYKTMPTVIMSIKMEYVLAAGIAAFASTTIATMFACYKSLRLVPAKLMRPTSPKEGKKILLERMTFIWKHFTFIQKITARNVFRYKKRLFMTIIGIAGCTALIFTGFGLKDSISSIVRRQYGDIKQYDFEITLKDELKNEQIEELDNFIHSNREDEDHLYLRQQVNSVSANGEEENVYVIAVENEDKLDNFIKLRNRTTGEKIDIQSEGIIVTEKLAKLLQVNIGDEITIKINDNKEKKVKVSNIAENYIYHYIYINKATYEEAYEEKFVSNHIYLNINQEIDTEIEEQISKFLLTNDNISQVLQVSSLSETFDNMLDSLNMVVAVLIICAGLLAFVVLYNLNSINIEERRRELATIKLLGFYNRELSSYVFRENIVLTIIGAVFGLVFGVYLLYFIITTAEMDIVMFGRDTEPMSYILAFCITIIFTIVINLIMNKELRKIDMIESLKSVE